MARETLRPRCSADRRPAESTPMAIATPYEDERLQRMPGTTTLSHFILQRMMANHGITALQRVQTKLSMQEPREQVHFLMGVFSPRLREELRAEQQVRGEREGDSFYAGEVIGPPVPETQTAPTGSSADAAPRPNRPVSTNTAAPPAARHQQWQNLRDICPSESMDGKTTKPDRPKFHREVVHADHVRGLSISQILHKTLTCPPELRCHGHQPSLARGTQQLFEMPGQFYVVCTELREKLQICARHLADSIFAEMRGTRVSA